jgi:TP901 family phage tail tape measure protein
MVNRIDIEVSARGNFSQLNAQIAELKAAVAQLQSKPLLGDSGKVATAQLAQIQTQFDKMLLSTRAFNVETVKMSNSIDNFGNRLQAGKLHFSEYARLYSQTTKGMRTELDSLAEAQARVAKSVILPDALKTGYARVITNLTSDLKSLNAAEEAAIIKTKALNTVIHGMGTSLVNMGKNTQWAGRQLTVGLTVPVAAFGAMAAKAFKDVNTELTRMQRMYGTGLTLPSDQEIAKVSTAIIDLSKKVAENMGIAQKETVTAAANFAAVGTTGDALITATEQAMRLSKLGAVNADTAQKTITSLQTTFRVGSQDVAEAVNFLNDIQKQTSTDLQDLTDAIPRVGPIVAQLGGTYKDTAVMMVAMKEAGVPAAQSANAIKSAVASMIGPTRQARDEFDKYGISLTKIKDSTQGNPIQMIQALQDSMSKLSPLVKEQLIEKLFGKFQFARVTALIDNLGRAGSQTQNAFIVAKASAGELAKLANQEMKIATESTTAKWQRALEGFKSTLMPLGEKFMKFGTKVLDFFSKIMHFLDKFKPLENFLVTVLGGAAIVGPVLMLVGLFGNLAGNVIKGVNYFRMFAKGVKSGGVIEGFKKMAEFFEMINVETLASSKNMDGLTSSTEKTVRAFEVLNQELGIMTRSLNEVLARGSRMPIIASPFAQQTLAQLQYANPNYNKDAGATEFIERPHMFPASRTWGGWIGNEQNIQGQHPMLERFLANKSMFPSTSDQEFWMRKGTSEQWGRPVPSGGLAAELQQKFGKEDVIYGPKFGVSKEDVYTRGFQKLEQIKLDIINGEIKADSKAAAEMEKIAALPIEEQTAQLSAIIDRVVFSEEQYFNNLIETLVQSQALLSAPEDMLKAVDMKIKSVMSDPTIADKPAEIQKVISEFNTDFKLLGGTIVEDITAYRLLIKEAILNANSAFDAAIVAAEFRAGIITGAEMSGGIRKSTFGKIASMDKHPLEQALGFTREVPKGFQTGGAIHAQDGVWVPGSGSGDRVPAMLEPGEFVVNRNAAKQYGGLLEHLNWNAAPRFGAGGKNPSSTPVGIRGYQTGEEVLPLSAKGASRPTIAAALSRRILGEEFLKLPGVLDLVRYYESQNIKPYMTGMESSHSIMGSSIFERIFSKMELPYNRQQFGFPPAAAYVGPGELNQIMGEIFKNPGMLDNYLRFVPKNFRKSITKDFMNMQERGGQAVNESEFRSTRMFLRSMKRMGVDSVKSRGVSMSLDPAIKFTDTMLKGVRGNPELLINRLAAATALADFTKSHVSSGPLTAPQNFEKAIRDGSGFKDLLRRRISINKAVERYVSIADNMGTIAGASLPEIYTKLASIHSPIHKFGLNGVRAGSAASLPRIGSRFLSRLLAGQTGGGIPGYQSGVTPVPSMKSLNKEEQEALMKEYIQKTMRPSSALSLLQDQIYSTVGPAQLELMQKGYGHEILQSNPKLAKLLEEYTFNTKSFVLRPGYTPERTKFDIFNTLGKDERFLLSMGKTAFETWQPVSMFASSERSPLFIRTLAQAIKEQGRGIGSIGIVPEELDLSPFSQKMYENLRKRGMPIETSGYEYDFRPNLYSQNDVDLEESRTTTKHIIDRFLRRVTTDELFNNSLTYRSTGEGPLSSVLNRAYVEQTDVQHRIPEVEAKATLMKFLRQGLLKQKGGGIPGYEEGGGPTWMARGNPYTEAQFQKSLESWIRPILHGMAPWNNPEKNTYRPMGETYNGFYRDIFNDQMRNIGRQDLLRAMVVDNVKGGANMHPWLTNMVNAAEDRYYPPDYKGIRVPAMENIQGPWVAQTTRPFTSFTDIKDTDFLKKRFMPAFSDKRFWNAMVRGNKLPFFLHAMTGPETMGLPVSKLFAGQTYYGNEGEYLLPQGQKFPMTGYSSDLATRLPIVHSIAPGSTKMIGGMRIPVAQTGGIIPGFTEGLTGPDFILERLKKSFEPGIHSQGINGVFSLMDQAGEKGAFFLKQMFFGGNEAQTTMALEAFMNQLHRGLGGPNAAVDQVVARIADKQLKEHLALKSPFLEEMQTYEAIGKAGQKSTILGPESQINAKETIKRYLEALLIGNKDLHSGNFGFLQGRNPIIIDSGEHFANPLNYNVNSAAEIERMKRVSQTTILPEFNEVANQAAIKLMRPDFDVMDFRRSQIELMKSKVTESFIQDLLMKATSNNPELISLMDRKATKSLGKPFAAGMTEILKSRLSSMGSIFRAQGGSWVPGSGDGDRVPAMLEPGEYVINKKAAKSYGGLLEDINWNKAPRFADGGSAFSRMVGRATPGGIETFGQYAKIITSMIPTVATQMAKDFAAGLRMGVSPKTYEHYTPLSAADKLGVKLANMNHLLPQWLSGGVSAFKTGVQNPDVAFKNVPAHFNKLSTLAVNTGGSIGKLGDFARSAGKLISSSFKDGVSAFKTGLQNPSYFKQTPSYFSGVQKFGYNMGALAPAALGNITNKIISAGEFLKQQVSTFRTGFQNPSYVGRTPEYFSRMEKISYTVGALMRPAGWKVLGNVMGDAIKSKVTYAAQWLTGKLPNVDRVGAWRKVQAIQQQTEIELNEKRMITETRIKAMRDETEAKAAELRKASEGQANEVRKKFLMEANRLELQTAEECAAIRLQSEKGLAIIDEERAAMKAAQLKIVDTPRSGPLGLLDKYKGFRAEMGPDGEPVRDPGTGKIKSKMFKGGMGSMIGGQMIGMLGMQVAGGMKEGGAKSAVNMASMGVMMGSMFGPEGMAIGAAAGAALGFATDAIKKESEKIKNAAAAYNDSIKLSSTSLANLGIKIRDFSNISFTAAAKLGTTVSKIDEYAAAYTNAQDEETKSTLAFLKLKAQEGDVVAISAWAQQKYNTAVAAGAKPTEVLADLAGELKAGGVSGTIAQGILLKGGINRPKSAIEAFKSGQEQQIAGVDFNKNALDPTAYVKAQGVGGYWSNLGKGWAGGLKSTFDIKTLTSDPSQYLKNYLGSTRAFGGAWAGRTSEKYSDQATSRMMTQQAQLFAIDPDKMLKMQSKLSGMTKTITESKDGFKAWNTELTKMMPDVGKFNTQLADAGFNTKQLYTLSAMQANGMNLTNQQYLNAAGNLNAYNIALARYATMQTLAKGDKTMNSIAEARQTKYDTAAINGASGANQKATTKTQDEIYALEDLNKSRQKEIDGISKEMATRQKEYDQQQKSIDQQKALADLKDNITRAAASGDLIAMASAQSSYNEELSKQQGLNEKEAKDNADQARINKIDSTMKKTQANIDKLQRHLNDLGNTLNDTFKAPEVKNFAEGMATMEGRIKELASTGKYKNIPQLMKAALADPSIKKQIDDGLITSEDIAKYLGLNEKDLKIALQKAYNIVKTEDKNLKVKLKKDNGGWLNSILENPNVKGITNTFSAIGIVIGKVFDKVTNKISTTVGGWGSSIANAVSSRWNNAISSISTAWTNFTKTAFGSTIQTELNHLSNTFVKPFQDAFNNVKTMWTGAFSNISETWADWKNLGPMQMAEKMETFLKDLPSKFTSGLSGLRDSFTEVFKSIAEVWNSTLGSIGFHVKGTNMDIKFPKIDMKQFEDTGKAQGGYIRGSGDSTSDSIPARLSNGEYVVKASSVARYGTSFLDGVNEQRFANGGQVGNGVPKFGLGGFIGNLFGKKDNDKPKEYGSWWSAIFDSSNRERKGFWGSGMLHEFANPFVQLGRGAGYSLEEGFRKTFSKDPLHYTGKNSLFKNNPYEGKDGLKNVFGDVALAGLNFVPIKYFKYLTKIPGVGPMLSKAGPAAKDMLNTIALGAKTMFGNQLSPALAGISNSIGLKSSKGASRLLSEAFLKEIKKLGGSTGINKSGMTGKYLVEEGGVESEYFLKQLRNTTGMEFEAFWNQFVRAMLGPDFAIDQKLFSILTKSKEEKTVLSSKIIPTLEKGDIYGGDKSGRSPNRWLWQYMLSKLTGNFDLHSGNLVTMNKSPFIVDSGASIFTNPDGTLFKSLRTDKDFGQHAWMESLSTKAAKMMGTSKTQALRSTMLEFYKEQINPELIDYSMQMAFPGKENLAIHMASLDRHMAQISNGQYKSFSEGFIKIMQQRFTKIPLLPDEDLRPRTRYGRPYKDGGLVGNNIPKFGFGGWVNNIFGKKDKDKEKPGYGSWWSAIMDSSDRDKRKGFWGSGVLHDLANPYVELGRGAGYSMEQGFRHAIFGKHSKNSKNQGFEDNPFRGKDGAKRLFGDVMLGWGAPKLVGKAAKITKPLWNPIVSPITKLAKKGLSWAGKGLSSAGKGLYWSGKGLFEKSKWYLGGKKLYHGSPKDDLPLGDTLKSGKKFGASTTTRADIAKQYAEGRGLFGEKGKVYIVKTKGNLSGSKGKYKLFSEDWLRSSLREVNSDQPFTIIKEYIPLMEKLKNKFAIGSKDSKNSLWQKYLNWKPISLKDSPALLFAKGVANWQKEYAKSFYHTGGNSGFDSNFMRQHLSSRTTSIARSYVEYAKERIMDNNKLIDVQRYIRRTGNKPPWYETSPFKEYAEGNPYFQNGLNNDLESLIRSNSIYEQNIFNANAHLKSWRSKAEVFKDSLLESLNLSLPSQVSRDNLMLSKFAVHRSHTLNLQDILMHPSTVPVQTGRAFGPGTYFGQSKEQSEIHFKGFGDNLYRIKMSQWAKLSSLFKKGYITPDKLVSMGIDPHSVYSAQWGDQIIQDLMRKGYLGLKHGDAVTNWLIGAKRGWGLTPIKKADGGYISGPGGPRADLVPAMLSNGEYVIQSAAVSKYGQSMLDAINGGNFGPKYATGGIIKSYSVGGSTNDSSISLPAPQYNVNIVVNGANASADDIADMVATRFRRETESMSTGRSLRA